jgi:pyruvate dehydrogenase E1 component alpha subunit
MNWAAVQRLPVIFVMENNGYAYSTPTSEQWVVDPGERAGSYGIPGVRVDGNDVEAMFAATWEARQRAIAGGGPTLLEAVTMRMHGHAAHDDMRYVPPELLRAWQERDPIDLQAARVAALGVDVDALRAEARDHVDAAARAALASPMPDPASALAEPFHSGEEILLGDGEAPYSGFAAEA